MRKPSLSAQQPRLIGLLCLGALTLGVAACGSTSATTPASTVGSEVNPAGDIPDNQAFVTYAPGGGAYAVDVPEGWARSGSGTDVSFTDKLNSVTIDQRKAQAAPTPASATAAVTTIDSGRPGFSLGSASLVVRSGGKAVLVTYQIAGAPDPVTGKTVQDDVERYAFWRQGTEVDITLSGPHGADNVDPWRTVTDSFQWR